MALSPIARLLAREPVPGHPGLILATCAPSRRLLDAARVAAGKGPLRVMRSWREISRWLPQDPGATVVAGRDLCAHGLLEALADADEPVPVVSLAPSPLAAFVLDEEVLSGPTLEVALQAARVIARARAELGHAQARAERLAERLADLRAIDPLTECASHEATLDAVQRAVDRARATGRIGAFALVRVDLPGFEGIAAERGERQAKLLVASVARRLEECAREGDLIGHVGAASLLILVQRAGAPQAARELAARIVAALADHHDLAGRRTPIRARVGWTAGSPHISRAEDALRLARAAS